MIRSVFKTGQIQRDNWAFLLLSQIMRGAWLLDPKIAIAAGETVHKLLNRDWDGIDQTTDLEKPRGRASFPFAIVGPGPSGQVLAETNFDKAPSGSTAIIPIKGTLIKYGTMSTYGTEEIAAMILEAGAHKNIHNVVTDIDSGGGSVDAVAPVIQAINKVRSVFGKPVIASCDLAASAAYWIASSTDKIVANNDISAEFGSIGVMMSFMDVVPYYEKQGYKFHTIYALESNYKHKEFNLALEGKYEEIQTELLSPLARTFQQAVKSNRGDKLNKEVEGILNGKMFFGKKAKEIGLIDEIGTLDMAVDIARDLSANYKIQNFYNN